MTGVAQQYLTVNEIAVLLRVHRTTVNRWIASGQLAAFNGGHSIRVEGKDLRRFIKDHSAAADPAVDELAEYLRQREADRAQPLCPHCASRETDPTSAYGWCGPCTRGRDDERRERELESKRRWWNEHGTEWRNQRKEKTTNAS